MCVCVFFFFENQKSVCFKQWATLILGLTYIVQAAFMFFFFLYFYAEIFQHTLLEDTELYIVQAAFMFLFFIIIIFMGIHLYVCCIICVPSFTNYGDI